MNNIPRIKQQGNRGIVFQMGGDSLTWTLDRNGLLFSAGSAEKIPELHYPYHIYRLFRAVLKAS